MSAREDALHEMTHGHLYLDGDRASELLDAYRAEVLREAHDAVRLDLSKLAEAESFSYGMAYQQGMDWAARVVDQLIDSP
jgi:hypothetical protein